VSRILSCSILIFIATFGLVSTGFAATPEAPGEPQAAATEPTPSANEAPGSKTVEESEEEAEKLANTLRWSTASEVENFGFDVYRGDSEEGPFERLTKKPILGAGTTDVPAKYQYIDDSIEADRAYWYFVESISMSGERENFTPTFRAAPKSLGDES